MDKINVGVSSCLLGEKVRYDGGHKLDHYIKDILGNYFSFISVCPEVECGMPVPRESMRLEGDSANPRLLTGRTHVDKTQQMRDYSNKKVIELEKYDLCGFIFKKDSPSSGLFRVKVYENAFPEKNGRGIFADVFVKHFPLVPVEEEGRLNDHVLRENFIERVFAYRRWKDFAADKPNLGKLVSFHTAHKLQIMSHSVEAYREMGPVIAHAKDFKFQDLIQKYEKMFMSTLEKTATVKKNSNVLMHALGYFKKHLSGDEKSEMLSIIDQYNKSLLPLIVPLTMLRHYVSKYNETYLKGQVYLSPHPSELMLRNHV